MSINNPNNPNNPTAPINPHAFEVDKNYADRAKFKCKGCGHQLEFTYSNLEAKVWSTAVNEVNRHTKCCGSKRWEVRNSKGHLLYSY